MKSLVTLLTVVGLGLVSCGGGVSTGTTQPEVVTAVSQATTTAVTVTQTSAFDGPVAAADARIEMTFTDDGTSYLGDHQIIAGTATVTFSNETTRPVTLMAFGYESGSAALAEELEFLKEGNNGVPSGLDPAEGFFDPDIGGEYGPGNHTWTIDLVPGTYIFDASTGDMMTTGLWRVAVIEVVSN
jgi:hypothetical protein